jgi:hypothetical protein
MSDLLSNDEPLSNLQDLKQLKPNLCLNGGMSQNKKERREHVICSSHFKMSIADIIHKICGVCSNANADLFTSLVN